MEKHTGYTLIELITSTAIIATLSAMAIPSFSALLQKSLVHTATIQLMETVQLTRNYAITRNTRTSLSHLGSWEDGWEIYLDENNNGKRDDDETPLFLSEKLDERLRMHGNRPVAKYVSYLGTGESRWATNRANGGAFQAGTFTICPVEEGAGYKLVLARGGRMRMESIEEEDCAKL